MIKPIMYLYISCITILCGMLFYALYNELLVIRFVGRATSVPLEQHTQRKTVSFYYWTKGELKKEQKEVLISSYLTNTLTHLVNGWLSLLEEEKIVPKKVSLQAILIDKSETEAYISFDKSPLPKELSTYDKLRLLQSLLQTILEAGTSVTLVHFLVNHAPLNDPQLDFSHGWPINGYFSK